MQAWIAQLDLVEKNDFLLRAAIVGIIVAVAWFFVRPRFDFSIVVERGQVRFDGKVAQSQRGQIGSFLEKCLTEGTVKIRGRRTRNGRLILAFRGPVDATTRQQIRNYLLTVL